MTRRAIARGIYQDAHGYAVRWRDQNLTREKRFPRDTPLETLKAFRIEQTRQARPATEPLGSFVRDVARFLHLRKGRPSFKSDRAHLRPWAHRFTRLSRWHITRDLVERAVAEWRAVGYSAREIRHRLQILKQLYHTLDGASARTPCDDVKAPARPKPRPISVSDQTVREVAFELWKAEQRKYLRDAKTRARYLILATTGMRPAQVKRARREDVDLDRRLWFVRSAKGDAGSTVYLNDDMLQAWHLFIAAQAWGDYDSRSFCKTLRRNGWPKGIRPYNLRHSVGLGLSARDVDLGDIQSHMGHASPLTTRMYVPGVAQRAERASGKLEGRIGSRFWALPQLTATVPPARKATGIQIAPQIARVQEQRIGRRRKAPATKEA